MRIIAELLARLYWAVWSEAVFEEDKDTNK